MRLALQTLAAINFLIFAVCFFLDTYVNDLGICIQPPQGVIMCHVGDQLDVRIPVVNKSNLDVTVLGTANPPMCNVRGCIQLADLPLKVLAQSTSQFTMRFSAKSVGEYSERIEVLLDTKPSCLAFDLNITVTE